MTGNRRGEARTGVIWSRYLFPGRRRHNLRFETAAGGGAKIDQQQNTGNDRNPEHEQQTCVSLSPDGLRGRRVFNVPPPTIISWEKHRARFPREAKFNKEKKSFLPHLENFFLVISHYADRLGDSLEWDTYRVRCSISKWKIVVHTCADDNERGTATCFQRFDLFYEMVTHLSCCHCSSEEKTVTCGSERGKKNKKTVH